MDIQLKITSLSLAQARALAKVISGFDHVEELNVRNAPKEHIEEVVGLSIKKTNQNKLTFATVKNMSDLKKVIASASAQELEEAELEDRKLREGTINNMRKKRIIISKKLSSDA